MSYTVLKINGEYFLPGSECDYGMPPVNKYKPGTRFYFTSNVGDIGIRTSKGTYRFADKFALEIIKGSAAMKIIEGCIEDSPDKPISAERW